MSYKIGIVGTGYVGLVTGVCLAEVGHTVLCVDIDAEKIRQLNSGHPVIFEKGLAPMLRRNLDAGRIRFTTHLETAVSDSDVLMFCLPTPPGAGGAADLRAVMDVAAQVAGLLKSLNRTHPLIVVNRSTVPVGTAQKVRDIFSAQAGDSTVYVVSNPEFLSEGYAIDDTMNPSRVVIGTSDEYPTTVLTDLYQPFVQTGAPIFVFDERSAEVTKYAANALLATKISFMNNLSEYCETIGADIDQVRLGVGAEPRIGPQFLFAGLGYGGSCFPKDVKAIVNDAEQHGVALQIVKAVHEVNTRQIHRFSQRIINAFGGSLQGKTAAVWGLAFKPGTDDIREAPSLEVINALIDAKASVRVYDPEAHLNVKKIYGARLHYSDDHYDAAMGADVLIIATEWPMFRNPDLPKLRELMKQPLIFDGRNIFQLDKMREHGFEYHSVGRPSVV